MIGTHSRLRLASFPAVYLSALLCVAVVPASSAQQVLLDLPGDFVEDQLGHAVAGIGDIDGDGLPDFLVGSIGDDDGGLNSGTARIVNAAGSVLLKVFGTPGEKGGWSLDGVGDVDGDGIADFAVGAPFALAEAGVTRVYSGQTGLLLMSIAGTVPGGRSATAVCGVGDVDLDGIPDVAIGSPQENAGAISDGGRARVFSGATGGLLRVMNGVAKDSEFGAAIAGLGDLIGDGRPELIIGAPGEASVGAARVFAGQNAAPLFSFHGAAGFDRFGASVDRAGDVNGDGFTDFLIGGPGSDLGGADAGQVTVVLGLISAVHTVVVGQPGDALGASVASVGDVDGDGVIDFVAGAPMSDTGGVDAGSAVLFSGSDGSLKHTLWGSHPGGHLGASVAGLGDANGDGFSDWAIGAPEAFANGLLSGRVLLVTRDCGEVLTLGAGCPTSAGPTPSLSLQGCFVPEGTAEIAIGGGFPSSFAWLLLGAPGPPAPIGAGCTLWITPVPSVFALPLDGAGSVSAKVSIPVSTSLTSFAAQAAVADPSSGLGFVVSNGLHVLVP